MGEAEMRKHAVVLAAADRAAKEASREGSWARDGPETEALKDAKLALAQVLSEIDEARLEAKRGALELQKQIDSAQVERRYLSQNSDLYEAPTGFGASIRRLLKV